MKNTFILLAGPSGSGKTTIANALFCKYGWKAIDSYTTRPPRSPDEKGHTFISEIEMDKIALTSPLVAVDTYNGYRYCATQKQVEENDIYVINPTGILDFVKHYKGNKNIKLVYLQASYKTRVSRMLNRGDTVSSIEKRVEYDEKEFSYNMQAKLRELFDPTDQLIIGNDDINNVTEQIFKFAME